MTITINLSPEEEASLRSHAEAQGTSVETVVHQLIEKSGPAPAQVSEKNKAAIALLQRWREEDMTTDEEELCRRDAELEELKANLNRWRAEEGRPRAFR